MEQNKKSLVALVWCISYDREAVENAVEKAIELLGGFDAIMPELGKNAELLLKPNLLYRADPKKAITTHPEVFRATGKVLRDAGYTNLKYGDSPGNPMISAEKTAEGSGLKAPAEELGIRVGNFESGLEIEFPEGRTSNSFVLCDEVARVCALGPYKERAPGGIINICKMKTHALERITGAVKNTFGCVHGMNKTASHARYATPEHFARMLADLNRLVVPKLHIMDGITAMEGNGPGSGDPVPMNVILASTDPVALDACFCHLVRLNTEFVPTNIAGEEAGIGTRKHEEIEVVLGYVPMVKDGTLMHLDEVGVKYGNSDFNVQRSASYRGNFRIVHLLSRFLEKKPVVEEQKCIGCGICERACPVEGKAISLKPRPAQVRAKNNAGFDNTGIVAEEDRPPANKVAVYNYNRCIKCYCCQEMCPEKAITVKKSLLVKLSDRQWKI
ncbi:MAG: DUF362 domain-containing protein [Eubacteriales bacterium]|nr:DUF362 domain-containing protein [Eubacteriales bacterium]